MFTILYIYLLFDSDKNRRIHHSILPLFYTYLFFFFLKKKNNNQKPKTKKTYQLLGLDYGFRRTALAERLRSSIQGENDTNTFVHIDEPKRLVDDPECGDVRERNQVSSIHKTNERLDLSTTHTSNVRQRHGSVQNTSRRGRDITHVNREKADNDFERRKKIDQRKRRDGKPKDTNVMAQTQRRRELVKRLKDSADARQAIYYGQNRIHSSTQPSGRTEFLENNDNNGDVEKNQRKERADVGGEKERTRKDERKSRERSDLGQESTRVYKGKKSDKNVNEDVVSDSETQVIAQNSTENRPSTEDTIWARRSKSREGGRLQTPQLSLNLGFLEQAPMYV